MEKEDNKNYVSVALVTLITLLASGVSIYLIILALNFVLSQNGNYHFNDLNNKRFLITGGATCEEIDPARKITNNS